MTDNVNASQASRPGFPVRLGRLAKRASLRWQICVLTGAAVLISLCLMGYFSFTKSRDIVTEARLDALSSEATVATNILHQALLSARSDLVEVSRFPPIPGIVRCLANNDVDPDPLQKGSTTEIWIQRLGTILSAQMANRPERMRATVVDQSGMEIAFVAGSTGISRGSAELSVSFQPADFVQRALRRNPGQIEWSETTFDQSTGSQVIHLATSFADADGNIRGAFIISLNAGLLFRRAADAITSGTTDIVDENGKYVFCEDNMDYVRTQRDYRLDKPVRAALLAASASQDTYRQLIPGSERPDGVSLIAIYKKHFFADNDPKRFWAVAPSIDATVALSAVSEIGYRFIWLGMLLIVLVGVFTFVTSRGLTRSLEHLAFTADRIAQGDLETTIPDDDPIGEVKGLRDSLATMTENLRNTIETAMQNERRTSAILNSTADGILSVTADGQIRSINSAALRLLGIKRDEAINSDVGQWIPALHEEDTEYASAPLHEGEVRTVGEESEVTGHHRSGRIVPLAMRVTEMEHVGQRLYIATLQDVTERKQIEQERQKSEQERERLFDGIREAVESLAAASTEILSTTTQQASSAQQQSASVTETATTVEELTHTADESSSRAQAVADSADRAEQVGQSGRAAVDATIVAMRQVRQQVESIAENIMSLSDRAQAIEGIIDAVKDIADQTNLLALNAAIEASRAGEHGRGFAVVASEVKALADQSRKATEKVNEILGKIQQGTNSAVMATEQGTKSVTEAEKVIREADSTIGTLSTTIGDASVSAKQILASANQQATAMRQIRDAMNHIDQATKQTLSATRQSEQSARDLNELGDRLKKLIAKSDRVDEQQHG